ncbi:UbiH/UbiF/VisC/COQ6 family ubiquinone biosynthesis hydroxylase [Pokkaliibacter sp. CJK22405]|uniref:UbiH/UbiF/VisC/COQ6 family ubiquinone biosynthesis hydroxylase n=1 Tax=Pokkaliibacter sp. CJK22405 TaxID=3384615 RepID=UPI003984B526
MSEMHTEIAVVGAGMVGAAVALGAAQQGWQVTLIDPRPAPMTSLPSIDASAGDEVSSYDVRVSALTESSRRLLEQLGVWEAMARTRISPYQHMHVWDSEGIGKIHFDAAEMHCHTLGHIVENRVTVMALHQQLEQAGVRWLSGKVKSLSLPESGMRCIQLESGERLQAKVIVGADGAESRVRQLSGIARVDRDYGHSALVATVKTSGTHQYTAWQRFMPKGPLALLPLADPHLVSIVWSSEPEHCRELMALDDDSFCGLLTECSEAVLGTVEAVSERTSVPLKMRHALSYQTDQVVMVGDAAHTIHPLAGQGVNLGFKDVEALLTQWQQAKARKRSPGEARWLQAYQRQRKADNWLTMAGMSGFKHLFGSRQPVLTLARNLGLTWTDQLPLLKRQMAARAMGLSEF